MLAPPGSEPGPLAGIQIIALRAFIKSSDWVNKTERVSEATNEPSSGWSLRDLWPHEYIKLWSRALLTKFGSHRTFLDRLTFGWPLRDLWPNKCITLLSRVILTKFDLHNYFSCWIIACLHIHKLICIFVDQLTSGWPLHDLWPDKCITLWSSVLLTRFDLHSYFSCSFIAFLHIN